MTIRELAKAVGLSIATVSHALRDSHRVNAKTREMVQTRARELGYTTNPIASGFLQQVRSHGSIRYKANLAFVVPTHGKYSSYEHLISGATDRARELGYGLDIFRVGDYEPAQLNRILLARGVLGVIVGPLNHAIGHMSYNWGKFSNVAYGYSMARPVISRVVHNHLHGIRTAFRMCRRKGFRRIGLAIRTEDDKRSNRLWSAGFLELQHTLSREHQVRPLLVPSASYTKEAIRTWLLKEQPEVAIIHTAYDISAFQNLNLTREVICATLNGQADDPCAGIDQRSQLCGGLLVDMLSAQVLHNQRGIPKTAMISLVEGAWMDHPSFIRPESVCTEQP